MGCIIDPLWPARRQLAKVATLFWSRREATGGWDAWCCYDTKFGDAQWYVPAGSSMDFKRVLSTSDICFKDMPPLLDPLVELGYLDKTSR